MKLFGKVTEVEVRTAFADLDDFTQAVNELAKRGEIFEISVDHNFCYVSGKTGPRYCIIRKVKVK